MTMKTVGWGLLMLMASSVQALEISQLVVREPLPGKTMTAGFMALTNTTTADQQLVSASASWAERIELHTHVHDHGVMRMRAVEQVSIAAGKTVTFKPGGLHLMVFGVQAPLQQELPITLCFASGECQTVNATAITLER